MHRLTFSSVFVVGLLGLVGLTGCPKKSVTIYKNLSEPGAMKTCDANQQYRVETEGATEADARANGEAQIRDTVRKGNGCGAYITSGGQPGKKLDGTYSYAANYQFCTCQ